MSPNPPESWESLLEKAKKAYSECSLPEAERFARAALSLAEGFPPGDPRLSATLAFLGDVRIGQGCPPDGIALYERAIRLEEEICGPESARVGCRLHVLAQFEVCNPRGPERAEHFYLRAISIFEKAPELDAAERARLLAFSLIELAELYVLRRREEEAEGFFQRALSLQKAHLDGDDPDLAFLHEHIGQFLSSRLLRTHPPRPAEAESFFLRALALREKAFGRDDPIVGQTLSYLNVLYQNEGRFADAERCLLRILQIDEDRYGPEHPTVAGSTYSLALFYVDRRQYAKADAFFRRALEGFQTAADAEFHHRMNRMCCLKNYVKFLRKTGRTAEAKACLPLLKRLQREIPPPSAASGGYRFPPLWAVPSIPMVPALHEALRRTWRRFLRRRRRS